MIQKTNISAALIIIAENKCCPNKARKRVLWVRKAQNRSVLERAGAHTENEWLYH